MMGRGEVPMRLQPVLKVPVIGMLLVCVLFLSSCATLPRAQDTAAVYISLGNSYLDAQRYSEAADSFAEAAVLSPGSTAARYNQAVALTLLGEYHNACELFTGLLEGDPDNIVIREALAWLSYQAGLNEEALNRFRDILSEYPAADSSRLQAARLAVTLENYEEAREHLEYLLLDSKYSGEVRFLFGELAYLNGGEGSREEAAAWYAAAAAEDPSDSAVNERLKELLDEAAAVGDLSVLIEIITDSGGPAAADLLLYAAVTLLRAGEREGLALLSEARKLGADVGSLTLDQLSSIDPQLRDELMGEFFL